MLELGSGTGIAGIVAALLGAHVVLTDRGSMMQLLQKNAAAHSEEVVKQGRQLWRHLLNG